METTCRFVERDDGIIEIDLSGWPGFSQALNDSVTSRAPRGEASGLSTYWIDRTLGAFGKALSQSAVIAEGNATRIARDRERVSAHSLYDLWPAEEMDARRFEDTLRSWRDAVVEKLGRHS